MDRIKIFTAVLILFSAVSLNSGAGIAANKTVKVKDSYNREVELPADVKRIGCLYAFAGHVVTMLGRGDDIVAVVRGLKRDVMLSEICPAIQNAAVPNFNDALNFEELARVKPDIVFIKDTVAAKKSDTETLTKLGIPYVVISFNTIDEQLKAVEIIGKAIGREKEAFEYGKYYRDCVKRADSIVKKIPEQKRVRLYHSILEPLKTDGPSGISAEWMKSAGVYNVAVNESGGFKGAERFVNIEQVLIWNPQVIIIHEDSARKTIMESRQWATVDAVKNGRIYRMPNGISRWGHPGSLEIPLALLWTVKTIYPESSSSIDIRKETVNFYKKFFSYNLSKEKTDKILHGSGMRKSKKDGLR